MALRFGELQRAHKLSERALAALDRDASRTAETTSGESAARYIMGLAAAGRSDHDEAERLFEPATTPGGPHRTGALLARARSLSALGQGREALALLSALPQGVSTGERRFEFAFGRADAFAVAEMWPRARRAYDELLRRFHPRLDQSRALLGRAHAERQMKAGSEESTLRRLALGHPETIHGEMALRLLMAPEEVAALGPIEPFTTAPVSTRALSAIEQRRRIFALYEAREYEAAATGLAALLVREPDDHEVLIALARLHGMILRDDLDSAITHLRTVLAGGEGPYTAEAEWRLVIVLGGAGRFEEALELARHSLESREENEFATSLAFRKARLYHEAGDAARARRAFADFVAREQPRRRTMFEWFVGWAAFRGGDYRQAIEDFRPLTDHPNILVGPKALYWTAVAWKRLEQAERGVPLLERVLDRYPLCYYSVLAQRKLAELGHERTLPGIDTVRTPPPYESTQEMWSYLTEAAPAGRRQLKELYWLTAVGDAPEARALLNDIAPRLERVLPRDQFVSVRQTLFDLVEAPHNLRLEAYRRHRRELLHPPRERESAQRWRAIYPRAYRRLAAAAAEREPDIPELLLYSVMLQESRYKRYAISSAPAYGVMQFLEKTGRRVAVELGLPYGRDRLLEPAYNIRLGARYLAALRRRYRGQLPLAIAAYNGGPRLMDAHLARFGHLPMEEMIEEIARHETRNYVRKVLDHYVRYVALYLPPGERKAAIEDAFPRTLDPTHASHPDY